MEKAGNDCRRVSVDFRRPTRTTMARCTTNSVFLVVGLLIGFMASSFLSMFASCPENSATILPWEGFSAPRRQQLSAVRPLVYNSSTASSQHRRAGDLDAGWSTVEVYYGTRAHLAYVSDIPHHYFWANHWFSQARQDEVVSALLRGKRNGYFVDLAANDAVRISNSYALETRFGWHGLCIEPNSRYWPSLSYRKCQVVGAVVGGSQSEEVQFQLRKDKAERGGVVIGEKFENTKAASPRDPIQPRMTVGLDEILHRFDAPVCIDYLSLDVEGAEELVLESFPFDRYRFSVMTIERPTETLVQLLELNGYVLLKKLKRWGETIWAHESVVPNLDKSALEIDTWNYKLRLNLQH